MKRLLLGFLILFNVPFTGNICAQDIPEPDFDSRPYYLKGSELEDMERTSASLDLKTKLYVGTETFYTAYSKKSDVRFDKDKLPRFFVKMNGNVDPEEFIMVVKSEEEKKKKKDRRRFKIGSRKMFGATKDISANQVEFTVEKIRDGIFEIILDDQIEEGEYAFLPISNEEVSLLSAGSSKTKITCFGID